MGKQKLNEYFANIQDDNKNLFVPYIVAGDGGLDKLQERIKFLEDSGVAAIELGIPFSDPIADGPTIQAASIRALEQGTTLKKVLEILHVSKDERKVPIILMTYLNPIYAYGIEDFAADCEKVGVDGVIIPDIPLEEEELIADHLKEHNIAFIRLAALTSGPDRLKEIAAKTEGFLYAVSVTGTTGARASHQDRVYGYLEELKKYSNVPVLVGFGVSNSEQAQKFSEYCDGVIVGSKIVDLFHQGKDDEVRKLIVESL